MGVIPSQPSDLKSKDFVYSLSLLQFHMDYKLPEGRDCPNFTFACPAAARQKKNVGVWQVSVEQIFSFAG